MPGALGVQLVSDAERQANRDSRPARCNQARTARGMGTDFSDEPPRVVHALPGQDSQQGEAEDGRALQAMPADGLGDLGGKSYLNPLLPEGPVNQALCRLENRRPGAGSSSPASGPRLPRAC